MRIVPFIIVVLLLCSSAFAVPTAQTRRAGGSITIDGNLNEPAWKKAKTYSKFVFLPKHIDFNGSTKFKILYDNNAIYFGIVCKQSNLQPRSKQVTKRDGSVWHNDDIEIFLAPGGKYYYQFAINSIATRYDGQLPIKKEDEKSALGGRWDGIWQAATHREKHGWTAEVRIPFATLGLSPKTPSTWKMNIGRTVASSVTYLSWAPVKHGFSDLPYFGELEGLDINTKQYIIDIQNLKFPPLLLGDNKVKFSLPVSSDRTFLIYTSSKPWQNKTHLKNNSDIKRVTSKSGKLNFSLDLPVKEFGKRKQLTLAIADAKTGKTILLRSHIFIAPKPLKASLPFMVYYAHEKEATISATILTASAKGNLTAVTSKDGEEISKQKFPINTDGIKRFPVPIKKLSNGYYKMKVTVNLQGLKPITKQLSFYIFPDPF